jgi:molybdenum cofactor cytidylyltransferase
MKFGTVLLEHAVGGVLGHSLRGPSGVFRKGRVLTDCDVKALREMGLREIIIARLDDQDLPEDEAAIRVAAACAGPFVRAGAAFTGRANLYAQADGLALPDPSLIDALNLLDESITIATAAPFACVRTGQIIATVKIIPFAAPRACVEQAERLLMAGSAVRLAPFRPYRAALLQTGLAGDKPSVAAKARSTIERRLESIGSRLVSERLTAHDPRALAEAIRQSSNADIILVLGAAAIADRRDVVPLAIEAAGGEILTFGMPVDPGNLLLTAKLGETVVVGLPGCARSPKLNGFDFVLQRIAAGLPIGRQEIAGMGVGGLLNEIPTRPHLRESPRRETLPARKIAAIILAAGQSTRMGSNKLVSDIQGAPLVRRVADAALASAAQPTIVVTGRYDAEVREALHGLPVTILKNQDYTIGLSSSLICGIKAVPEDCDGVIVLLGDMPKVSAELIERLIEAFDPGGGRAICVPTWRGKRGNPVLWARVFFDEIMSLKGDVGAKNLIGQHEEAVCEVEWGDDAPLVDIDTPQALAACRQP